MISELKLDPVMWSTAQTPHGKFFVHAYEGPSYAVNRVPVAGDAESIADGLADLDAAFHVIRQRHEELEAASAARVGYDANGAPTTEVP